MFPWNCVFIPPLPPPLLYEFELKLPPLPPRAPPLPPRAPPLFPPWSFLNSLGRLNSIFISLPLNFSPLFYKALLADSTYSKSTNPNPLLCPSSFIITLALLIFPQCWKISYKSSSVVLKERFLIITLALSGFPSTWTF